MTEEERNPKTQPEEAQDRRQRPRPAVSSGNWEAIALSRVARKVETLGNAMPEEPPAEYGWEERALRNLRQRIKDKDAT